MNEQLSNFKVADRQTFIKFLDLLRKDFLENREEWQNKNIEDFLEAMTRYTEDIQGYYDNTNQNIDANKPRWEIFADTLKGSKIYE